MLSCLFCALPHGHGRAPFLGRSRIQLKVALVRLSEEFEEGWIPRAFQLQEIQVPGPSNRFRKHPWILPWTTGPPTDPFDKPLCIFQWMLFPTQISSESHHGPWVHQGHPVSGSPTDPDPIHGPSDRPLDPPPWSGATLEGSAALSQLPEPRPG